MNQLQGTTQIVFAQPATVVDDISDLLCQNIRVERLGDVVVGSLVQPLDHEVLTDFGSKQNDRQPCCIGIFLQPSAKLITIHSPHHHVGNHDVACAATQIGQSLFGAFLRDDMIVT